MDLTRIIYTGEKDLMKIGERKRDFLIYTLSKGKIIFLFIYYFLIMMGGGICIIMVSRQLMMGLVREQILQTTLILSLAVSGMLCSMQYIKRLYKACLTGRIENCNNDIQEIGNMAYFLFRPFFAFGFTIVMVFAVLSGMFVVTGNLDYILNDKFVYLCMVTACYIGYSVGKVLDIFEKVSEKKVSKLV